PVNNLRDQAPLLSGRGASLIFSAGSLPKGKVARFPSFNVRLLGVGCQECVPPCGSDLATLKLCNLAFSYCPVGAAAVFSGTGAVFSGAAVLNRIRNGKKGVTSNGIFSAAVVMATGLVLINSSRLFHGSTLTRPPRGSAATWSTFFGSNCGEAVINDDILVASPLRRLSPKCVRIRFFSCGARAWTALRNKPALLSLSLYGELLGSSMAFLSAASSSPRSRAKSMRSKVRSSGKNMRSLKASLVSG